MHRWANEMMRWPLLLHPSASPSLAIAARGFMDIATAKSSEASSTCAGLLAPVAQETGGLPGLVSCLLVQTAAFIYCVLPNNGMQ